MEKGDLTYRIIGCAITVHNKLKRGFREYVYCRALAIELGREQIAFEREVWLPIHYDNYKIAARRCDFLCNQVEDITPEMVGEANNDLFESRQYLPPWLVEKMQRDDLKQKLKK